MRIDRREFMKSALLGGGLLVSGLGPSRVFASTKEKAGPRLVVVFLYGGADPLTLFPPYADESYYAGRPGLAVDKSTVRPLDGLFGLHPALSPLETLWQKKEMGIIHHFGLPKVDRSHQQAKNTIEFGSENSKNLASDGFLSRALVSKFGGQSIPLRALALQPTFPNILMGPGGAIALSSIDELRRREDTKFDLLQFIDLYGKSEDLNQRDQARLISGAVDKIRTKVTSPSSGRPEGMGLKFGLNEIARLINADLGVRLAFTSTPNDWDTHFNQVQSLGPKLKELGESLASFRSELEKTGKWQDTVLVVMTEFGRAIAQNGSLGSEHGHGSAAIVMGGGLKKSIAGRVLHKWTSLREKDLSEGRELSVHHDYRDVFGELLAGQLELDADQLAKVFPSHRFSKIGLT
ncbi:MAG: DUF1501 domain-containing protein [Bdellovibrionota bacterium]